MTKRSYPPFTKPIYMVHGDPSSPIRAVVTFSCMINELTIFEHQSLINAKKLMPLSYEEAVQIHGQREADEYFRLNDQGQEKIPHGEFVP